MSLIIDLYSKLQASKKPLPYVELAASLGTNSVKVRNAVGAMISRGFPVVKGRSNGVVMVSINTKHTYDYFCDKNKALAKRARAIIEKAPEPPSDCDIAKKLKITVKYAQNLVGYLKMVGMKISSGKVDGNTHYRIIGKVYNKKVKGCFDNQCIDHLLFHGSAMEAVRLHKSINEMRG